MTEFERFIALTDKIIPLISKVKTDLKNEKQIIENEIKQLEVRN